MSPCFAFDYFRNRTPRHAIFSSNVRTGFTLRVPFPYIDNIGVSQLCVLMSFAIWINRTILSGATNTIWVVQRIFHSPSQFYSTLEPTIVNRVFLCPFSKALRFPIVGIQAIATLVACLLTCGRPSNIAGFVIAIIVNTVDAVTCFTAMGKLTDMGVKCLKIMLPFFANGDTTSSIMQVRTAIRIGATLENASPNAIQRIVTHSMRAITLCKLFSVDAPAGQSISIEQIRHWADFCASTDTLTEPQNSFSLIASNWPKRGKTPEGLSRNIFGLLCKGDILRHVNKLLSAFDQAAGHFAMSLRQTYWGCYQSILAHLVEWCKVACENDYVAIRCPVET